jgi:valyl-tRNA synthetase
VPESWTATYYQWMRNIEPWCVSRQLWWGHRIPAWYDEEGQIFVEETEAEAHAAAKAKHGRDVTLIQDEDVLDTWFSSGLWPFSTLGWPEDTAEMSRFYPTSTLVTMFDIIFFWVARMMMFGCHFTGKAPFSTVVIHSRVVDENGKKMSKSKGNIIDPTVLIDTYGADALRFTLAIAAGPGRDIRMSDKRVEGYRNFGTKLWNAARFAQMNECSLWEAFEPSAVKHTLNRWIVSELTKTAHGVEAALSAHRFDEAAQTSYAFVWGVFCDLYLELVKPLLNGDDEEAKSETRRTVAWVLDQILKILHPFMPFVTEELWDKTAEFGPKRTGLLINEAWPKLDVSLIDEAAAAEVGWVVDLVTGLRSLRSETNVPAGAKVPALLIGASKETALRLERYQAEIDRLARLDYSVVADAAPAGSVTFVLGEAIVAIPLAGVMDIGAEKARLSKEIARCTKEIETVSRKLDNPGFVAKAPAEVIEEQRERRAAYEAEKQKYEAALTRLG